jgi:S1-C subfamily serine protease
MYQAAIEKIKKSIFPIFYKSVQEETIQIGVSGTGFFISNQGHFITALHVITQTPANSTIQYSGNIPHHIINPPHPITEIYRDPLRDIFLGKINFIETTPVTFVLSKPNIGKSVCLCGYPLAKLVKNLDGSINVDAVRQYWQPTFIIDIITVSDTGKNYPGFLTQHTSLNGMSGAPVFDTSGVVYGIDTAFLQRRIPQKNKPAIQVFNGIAIENASIADVYAKII